MASNTVVVSALCVAACGSQSPKSTSGASADVASDASAGPQLCAALRGNGTQIYGHFSSLARMVEQFGLFDGMAGGSSATLTMFTYESILKHPALRTCTDANGIRNCSNAEIAARAALLLKSVGSYVAEVGVSDGILGNDGVASLLTQIQNQGLASAVDSDPVGTARQLQALLSPQSTARLKILINPEITAALQVSDPQLLAYNAHEVLASIEQFGSFTVTDNRLFFRPGLIDFSAAAATTFAVLGDFYAGYAPADIGAMQSFLDQCALPSKGLLWTDPSNPGQGIDHLPASGSATCADLFTQQVSAYVATAPLEPQGSRIDEPIGGTLNALAAVAVVTGASISAWNNADALYQSGQYPTGDIPFNSSFSDVKIGYWGSQSALSTFLSNPMSFTDERTQKATSLGTDTWRAILSRSPAEPGLAHFLPLPDGSLSAGGWPDLAPVLALANLGCGRVVYVTRHDPEGPFATGVATKLGMTDADEQALYDLSNPQSSFTTSLRQASGVWCANWDAFGLSQIDPEAADSYSAPLETHDQFFSAYANVVQATGLPGCTPGVAP